MGTYEENIAQIEELVLEKDLKFAVHDFALYQVDVQIAVLAKYDRQTTLFDIFKAEELNDYSDSIDMKILSTIHPHWFDIDTVVNSDRNLLNNPKVESGWKAGYQNALAHFLVENGDPVGVPESVYGWKDYDINMKDPNNPVVAVVNVFEDSWSEFVHTFTDNHQGVGMSGEVIFKNGLNRILRYEATFLEIIQSITQ